MEISIRREVESDYRRVEEVTREAFWNLYVPGCNEHYLTHVLRDHKDFIPELDFVAVLDGKIIANIMYARSYIVNESGDRIETVTFGPVCVLPEYQKKGIGSKIIRHTMKLAEGMGFPAVLIFGDPQNYCKHGFMNGIDLKVSTMGGIYPHGFLVLELKKGIFAGHSWEYYGSDVYNITDAEAEEFDKRFEPKVKEWKPSQEVFSINWRSRLQI